LTDRPHINHAGTGKFDEWGFPNRATPLGSSAYYSLRFAQEDLRNDLAALTVWRYEIRRILEQVTDPGVARIKLQWWREELERTFAGKPYHPLTRILHPVLERHALPQDLFAGIADRVESEILRQQPPTEADLDAACDRDLGALFELLARCHGLIGEAALRTARRHGGFCARVYLIRDSGALAREGRAVVSAEQLCTLGLSREALAYREHRGRLPELLQPAAFRARARLAESDGNGDIPVCIRARTGILVSLLHELEREGFDVADRRIGLTPLRKLWLAWRASRRK
jgi:phytoene synthase